MSPQTYSPKANYTATQIVAKLGLTVRAVYKAQQGKAGIRAAVQGNVAQAWPVADWAESLIKRAEPMAKVAGCRDIDHFMQSDSKAWLPRDAKGKAVAWELVPQECRKAAEKLRDAFAGVMALPETLSREELLRRGQGDYRAVFGEEITPARWWRIHDRAIHRAGGRGNWDWAPLYTDACDFQLPKEDQDAAFSILLHAPLDDIVKDVRDRTAEEKRTSLSAEDREWLWQSAFEYYEGVIADKEGMERKRIKASLLDYLFRELPALSDNRESLRRVFDRIYKDWVDGGRTHRAIADLRASNSGRVGDGLCDPCRLLVIGGACGLDGNLSLAWERLHTSTDTEGRLCLRCLSLWKFDMQNKDYVPESVRRDVTPAIKEEMSRRRGRKYQAERGPKVIRDWTNVAVGDWFSADDTSLNHPFFYRDRNGDIRICRGECLVMTEERTGYIVHYILIAGLIEGKRTSYTGWNIRQLMIGAHDRFGLPRKAMSFENGVWGSRIVAGERHEKWENLHFQHAERGLRESGLDLEIHHHLPGQAWGKPIEAVIGILQRRMSHFPFYVGRNSRTDKRDEVEKLIREARKDEQALKDSGMLEMGTYRKHLDEAVREYNDTVQNGDMLRDSNGVFLSPAQAIRRGICGQPGIEAVPLRTLSDEARALALCSHRRIVDVTSSGIEIDIRGRRCPYWSEALGRHKYEKVWAYINIDMPDLLVCSDLKRQKFFSVTLKTLPARGATKEQLSEIARERNAFMRPSRVEHSQLPHPFRSNIKSDYDCDKETKEGGRFVIESMDAHEKEQTASQRRAKKNNRVLELAGRHPIRNQDDPFEISEGLREEYPDKWAEVGE